jgi:hypothetical protein
LATAKDTIVKWFEDSSSSGPHQSSAVPNKPLPGAGDADVALRQAKSEAEKET